MTKLEPTRTSSDLTATERLRELLDERGVEWMPSVFDPQHETFYSTENGVGFIVTEFPEIDRMSLACDMRITPEQAIAATLGRGMCHNAAPSYLDFLCSACGFVHYHSDTNDTGDGNDWSFCPNCGRKVVDE